MNPPAREPTLNGEPVLWELGKKHYIECCSCGLVHVVFVEKITKRRVYLTFYRDDFLTKQARKEKK